MADTELNVILRLTDEMSKNMEKARNSVKEMGEDIRQTGRQLQMFGRNVAFLGAAITGPLALAFKTASEYSTEANIAMNNLKNATINLQTAIGTALSPVMNSIASTVQKLTNWFNSLDETTRRNITQLVFIGGILLTVGGAITILIAKITMLTGALMAFAAVHPYILAVTIAIAGLILFFDKLNMIATPVLNFLQLGASNAAIAFLHFTEAINNALAGIMSKIPGMKGWADEFTRGAERNVDLIAEIQTRIDNIKSGGTGELAAGFDELMAKLDTFFKKFQLGATTTIPAAVKVMDATFKTLATTFSAISTAASSALSSISAYFVQAQGESKKFATTIKALRIAETIINTAAAVMLAWATYPYPMSAVIAGFAIAAGAFQVATIAAQEMAAGGIVTRPTLALIGEAGPEAIIPLNRRGGYGGGDINIVMENVSFRSENDIEDVMIRLSNLISVKTRSKI